MFPFLALKDVKTRSGNRHALNRSMPDNSNTDSDQYEQP